MSAVPTLFREFIIRLRQLFNNSVQTLNFLILSYIAVDLASILL